MTPYSQNPSKFFDPGSQEKDFFSIIEDPGRKCVKTPPRRQQSPQQETPPQQPLISGGPTKEHLEIQYQYAQLPHTETLDVPSSLQNVWDSIIDDLRYGAQPEDRIEKDQVGEILRQCAELPPGSPFYALLMFFAKKYAGTANAQAPEERHEAECILDALLNIIPEIESAVEISEEPFAPLSALSVQRRIKTKYSPRPVFMGIKQGTSLTEQETKWLAGLSELNLHLFTELARTTAEKNIIVAKPLIPLLELLNKIAAADAPQLHIEPWCRAAFLSALPSWWSNELGGYYLHKIITHDTPFDLDTPLAIRQHRFLHALRSRGTQPAIAAGVKGLMMNRKQTGWTIPRVTGKLIQNIILPSQRLLSSESWTKLNEQRLESLKQDLQPYYEALLSTRSIWQGFEETLRRDVLKHEFAPGGGFHSLLEKSAYLLAGMCLQSHHQLPELDKDIETAAKRIGMDIDSSPDKTWDTEKAMAQTEMVALINLDGGLLWQQLKDIFGAWVGGTGTVEVGDLGELYPNITSGIETAGQRNLSGPQKIRALEQNTARWFINEHYDQVIRFTLFLILVARLIHEPPDRLPKIPGVVIPEITLYQPDASKENGTHHSPVYCDGIVFPQGTPIPLNPENRRLDTILNGQTMPISIVEVKTIISLYGFLNSPQKIRKQEKDQLEKYLSVMGKYYPNVSVKYVYLYYVTFNRTRLFRYPVINGEIDYEGFAEIKPQSQP